MGGGDGARGYVRSHCHRGQFSGGRYDHYHRKQNKLLRRHPGWRYSPAECTPLHRGRTTMVWQTRVTRSDGRVAALVIQTQLVLPATR